MIDDGTITRLAGDRFRVTAADPSYRWFALNASGLDVRIRTTPSGRPGSRCRGGSREVLEAATGQDWSDLRYFRRRPTRSPGPTST